MSDDDKRPTSLFGNMPEPPRIVNAGKPGEHIVPMPEGWVDPDPDNHEGPPWFCENCDPPWGGKPPPWKLIRSGSTPSRTMSGSPARHGSPDD